MARSREERWRAERQFFDDLADRFAGGADLDPKVVARYLRHHRPWINKEYRFAVVGDLRGKRVLDVGCGNGDNALLLARMGARVTGVDIAPKLVALAQQRAAGCGLSGAVEFLCSPLEVAPLPARAFDVVWGDGFLHHVIDDLDPVLARLRQVAREGALFVFSEPVSFARALRRLRRHVPIHTDATPDERPLEPAELAVVRRHLPDLALRRFGFLGRLNRLVVRDYQLESAPGYQRAVVGATCALDQLLLRLPVVRNAASMVVMTGHAAREPSEVARVDGAPAREPEARRRASSV